MCKGDMKALCLASALLFAVVSMPAHAIDASRLEANLPTVENLKAMEPQLEQNPGMLDPYFDYARMAMTVGEFQRAAGAYEHMLKVDPSLDRVKLDLSLAYAKLQRFDDAKSLLQEVLKKDIPDKVKENIQQVLKQLDEASKLHEFTGSVGTGLIHDSNGNSVSGSGNVTVFDASVPLDSTQQARDDYQWFASASLNHRYRLAKPLVEDVGMEWNSSAGVYRTEQENLDELNIQALSLSTGPSFVVEDWRLRTNLKGNYTHVVLAGHTYLKVYSGEWGIEHVLPGGLHLQSGVTHEYREFVNSPEVSTYEDRSGPAEEVRVGLSYPFSDKGLGDLTFTFRHEDTKRAYYDNNQFAPVIGYTRLWEYDIFSRLEGTLRDTKYDEADNFISTRKRRDLEKSFQLLIGKNFPNNISLTGSYQYRNVDSTIENYEYQNHRLMTSLGWRF